MSQLCAPATVAQFRAYFFRDFEYGPGLDKVTDTDIQNAINGAGSVFNPALFSTAAIGIAPNQTSEAIICYLNCSAHFLVTAIQAVGGLNRKGRGVRSQGEGVTASKSAGGIQLSMEWPAMIKDSPVLFQFTRTSYGCAYLQVLMTRLVGNVGAVGGETAGGAPPNPGFF